MGTQSTPLQQVADQFYPVGRLNPRDASERFSALAVLSRSATDDPTALLAAYTDRTAGVVSVLQRTASGDWAVAAESPAAWALGGGQCDIRLSDIDFDGRPEALVSFIGARAATSWVFRWDGTALSNLTPTRSDGARETSLLLNAALYDLEHTGSLRLIAERAIERPGPGQRPRNPAFVYRLGPAGFEVEKTILAVMGFRTDVDPRGNVRSFRLIEDSVAPYTLRVINGDRMGRNRVTRATVFLNDQWVAGLNGVGERSEVTTVTLPRLSTTNRLTATLTGQPEATILVLVEDSTRR